MVPMSPWGIVILCILCGSFGAFIMALLVAAGRADDQIEAMERQREQHNKDEAA